MKRLLAFALVFTATGSARAYVRSRTSNGTGVYWSGSCVFITPDSTGSKDLSADTVFSTIQKSMNNWVSVDKTCSYLQLTYEQPEALEAHYDGKNIVKFRTDRWCHPDDSMSHNQCYDSSAAAITTAFFIDKQGDANDGQLLDADIELNDINFTFQVLPSTTAPRAGTEAADLENTLTHEIGHLQGLDHTCADSSTPPYAVDENGVHPPPCSQGNSLPAKITTATMYNVAHPGDIDKRSPEQDDINGICAVYPIAKDPKQCGPVNVQQATTTKGCQFGGSAAPGSALWLALLSVLALATRRRARG